MRCEGEEEARNDGEGGVEAEEGVERPPAADIGGGHGGGEGGVKIRMKEAGKCPKQQLSCTVITNTSGNAFVAQLVRAWV